MKEYTKIKEFHIKGTKTDLQCIQLKSSKESCQYIRQFYGDDLDVYESFFILLLNRANMIIGYAKISQGGICGTVVDKKIIAKYCLDTLASGVILAHNHPSGNTSPSKADINITNDLKQTLSLFDCLVLDHIILTENSYYSFADEGMI